MFTKILVGYDGSPGGKKALHRAIMAAKNNQAELIALWVRESLPRHSDLPGEMEAEEEAADEYFQARKAEVEAAAREHGIPIQCVSRHGHAAKAIVTFAKEQNCDLIVVGHSDHSELWGRLLGDTADRVSDHAHCSVLIVKS